MVRTFLLVGLLATGAASAQTVTIAFNFQDADSYKFNAAACPATITANWTSTFTVGVCSELKLWTTELECGDTPGVLDPRLLAVPKSDVDNVRTGTFNITINELPGFKPSTDGGVLCGAVGIEKQHKVCSAVGVYNGTSGVCVQQAGTSLTMLYDTRPPTPPTIDEVSEQDGALQFKFTASSDTAVVHFEARP
ncbi:MAG: fibronectin type domain protein, partial [Myxococcaceae bacterium]|nr:fibronectin type domain protein [Myxococcaceae bacterium]